LVEIFSQIIIFLLYTPLGKDLENRVQLFSEIATTDIIDTTSNEIRNVLNDITIDFDSNVKHHNN